MTFNRVFSSCFLLFLVSCSFSIKRETSGQNGKTITVRKISESLEGDVVLKSTVRRLDFEEIEGRRDWRCRSFVLDIRNGDTLFSFDDTILHFPGSISKGEKMVVEGKFASESFSLIFPGTNSDAPKVLEWVGDHVILDGEAYEDLEVGEYTYAQGKLVQ